MCWPLFRSVHWMHRNSICRDVAGDNNENETGKETDVTERMGISMKIIVTATGPTWTDSVDMRFGRAKYFLVVDTDADECQAVDNQQNLNAVQGAGIQAGQQVAGLGVSAVVTGNVGPKAYRVLSAAGIKVFIAKAGMVRQAVDRFKADELEPVTEATVEGHW